MRKIWPFTFNFFWFACGACVVPFFVLFYQELGFTGTQIGLLTGITPLITSFSAPFWTGLADAKRRHRLIMNLALLIGAISIVIFPLLKAFLLILIIVIVLNFFLAPVQPFADSATMFMLADEKEMYGRIRLGGTIGYGLAASIAGMVVENYGLRLAFLGSACLMLLAFIISQKLVYGQKEAGDPVEGSVRTLLMDPRWLLFLTVAFVGGLTMAATNNYFFPYMKELGVTESTMGLALMIGTAVEIPVLFWGNRFLKLFKSYRLFMLAMVLTGVRFLLFAVSGTPNAVLFVQLLNGLNFPIMWVAGVSYANENAPAGMSTTALGLFTAMVFGFGNAVGGFMGGLLLERIGGSGIFLVYGVIVFIVLAVVTLLSRRLTAKRKKLPDASDGLTG
ncbi:MAG: MFS transporter [Anaerolineaceae bacterium]|nr:MAG: MFS transporter [Anaerolineaceae bacterium]